ncbi:MAG: preprotein translocase subunit SecE [Flavobacteriales bacterium]|nr:MAG: preprotein translocase subunit SecE [Flavobacteriales bacterium]
MKIKAYIDGAVEELLHKVSWPTWGELQSSSIIVLVATFIIALIIYIMDFFASNVLRWVYEFFG